jgi:hypothetical protein
MFGITSAKVFYFQIIILLLSVWIISNALANHIKQITINLCDIFILCFSIWCLLRCATFSDIINILSLFLLYFTVKYISDQLSIEHQKHINYMSVFIISSIFIQLLIGLFQLYGIIPSGNYNFKITGTASNPAVFSQYLAAFFPVILAWYFFPNTSGKPLRVFKTIAFLTLLLIIVLLASTLIRTAWIGLIAGSIVVILFYCHRMIEKMIAGINHLKRVIISCIILCMLFTGGYYLYQLKVDSAFGRLFIWEVSLNMLKNTRSVE